MLLQRLITRHAIAPLAALSLTVVGVSSASAEQLNFKIDGVRNDKGVVHILLFNNARAFNKNLYAKLFKYVKVDAKTGSMTGTIEDLPRGKYAIMFHHDENNNGEFEMKGAVPLEGWAYSNNVGAEETPKFAEAAFEHTDGSSPLDVRMLYVPQ